LRSGRDANAERTPNAVPTATISLFRLGRRSRSHSLVESAECGAPERIRTSGPRIRNPWGFLPLRERLALTLGERSIKVSPEQVLLTQGANHALDLVARQLLEPGDTALVDSPGYYPLFGKLKLAKVEIADVRRLSDGPDLDELAAKAANLKPKVFFTQSLAHNPTGGSITPACAYRLLQIAEQHGFYVVEDDPFADVLPAASPRLAALDQLERVIYIGTFGAVFRMRARMAWRMAGSVGCGGGPL